VGGAGAVGQTRYQTLTTGAAGVAHIGGYNNIAPRITGISGVRIFNPAGNNAIENGTYLAIYKRNP